MAFGSPERDVRRDEIPWRGCGRHADDGEDANTQSGPARPISTLPDSFARNKQVLGEREDPEWITPDTTLL